MNSRKAVAVGILVLFIGASILPVISGAPQNLILSKNPGKHGKDHPQKIQKDSKNNLGKNQKTDTNIHTQPTKSTPNPKNTKQVTLKDKHETAVPSFAHDANIKAYSFKDEGSPQPLGNNVHNVQTGEDFATIQAAIDDPQTLSGHTLIVSAGTYPENVLVSKSLTIRGNNATSMPVIDGMGSVCFNITANSVTLKWLNFTNAMNAINCSASGFTIVNNTFYYDSNGVVWRIYKTNLAASQNILASMVKYNTFYSSSSSPGFKAMIYVDFELYYQNNSGFTVSIGDISFNQNTFYLNSSTLTTAIYFDSIYVYYLFGGTISVGKINVSANTMYGGDEGLDFYGEFYQIKNVQLTAGDFIVTHNLMVNQTSYGVYIDYYDGESWSGTTHAVFGELQITDNTVQSTQGGFDGLTVSDYGYWYNYSGTTSLQVGDMIIEDNSVDVTDYGIDFELYYVGESGDPLEDTASVTLGDFRIQDNTVYSNNYNAIYILVEDCGTYMYDYATCTIGSFLVRDNTLTSNDDDGIYVSDFYDLGYELYDHSSFTMGDISFSGNGIDAYDIGIDISYLGDFGEDMYNSSSFTMGSLKIIDNNITSSDYEGIYTDIEYFGYDLENNAEFTMDDILITDNVIDSYDEGIYIEYIYGFGEDLYNDAMFTMGNIEVIDNNITSIWSDGIYTDIEEIGYDLNDDSVCTVGNILFNHNWINASDDDGLYFEYIWGLGYEMYDFSEFTMGNIEANYNTIIAGSGYGIYIEWYDIGYYLGDASDESVSFVMGDLTCSYNNVTSTGGEGIYTEDVDDIGGEMYGTSTCTIGNIQFNHNIIHATNDDGLYLYDPEYYGYDMYDDSQFTMGNLEADNNTIYAGDGDGIYLYYDEFGYYMGENVGDHCVFTMGDITCNDNSITNIGGDGIYVEELDYLGYNMYGNSEFTMGDITFNRNTIDNSQVGESIPTDNISDSVHIARDYFAGIYNSVSESSYQSHYSPENTEWSNVQPTPVADPTVLSYTNWQTAVGGDPPSMVGQVIYMHIVSENRYFQMNFTFWQQQGGGGFSYTRYELVYNDTLEEWVVGGGVSFSRPNSNPSGGGSGIYFDFIGDIGYEMYDNSQFSMGNLEANHNTIIAGDGYGIYIDWSEFGNYLGDTGDAVSFTMGHMTCNYNNVTSTGGEGIYTEDLDDLGEDMYGSSTYMMGNIEFNHNRIHSTDDDGLYLYDPERFGEYMQDNSTYTMGNLEANDNIINAGNGNGIYMYYDEFGYVMGNPPESLQGSGDVNSHCVFIMGDITCDNNNVTNSGAEGIYVEELDYVGAYMAGYSTATIGNVTINDNIVNTTGYSGIGISSSYDEEGMYDFGYQLFDHAQFTMGNIQINDNMIKSTFDYGLNVWWMGDFGESLYDDSQATFGNIEINDNFLNDSNGDGIIYEIGDIGSDLHNNATVTVRHITVNSNTVISGDDGITDEWSGYIGEDVGDNAVYYGRGLILAYNTIDTLNDGIRILNGADHLIVGANTIVNAGQGIHAKDASYNLTMVYNSVSGTENDSILFNGIFDSTILGNFINASQNDDGIALDSDTHNITIVRNTISNNSVTGINATTSYDNLIYHNNILNNTLQAYDDTEGQNMWDNGYPSGGNYWSDYLGHDSFSGSNQNIAGSDGIGDTPYNITHPILISKDNYPFKHAITINHPSIYTPSNPSPANGATGVAITTDTSWSGGDPDNDYDSYDIYFGTTNPPAYYDTVYFIQGSPIGYKPATLALDTTYYWKIVAWDGFGDSASGPVWSFYTGTPSQVPEIPPVNHYAPTAAPGGPYNGDVGTPVQFDGTGSHTNGDGGTIVEYDWSFFTGDAFHDLGPTPTHTYDTAGTYTVSLRVLDSENGIGIDSTTATIRGTNTPPNTPTINGPTTGDVSTAYTYSFTSTDPDNNNLQYVIDWGDGSAKTTSPFGASGDSYTASHTWAASGIYSIKVYAEDIYGGISGTATYLVTIGTPTTQPLNGYLVDTNGDGTPDSWHNNNSGQTTSAQRQADGTYLIDVNGDGAWDYIYNPATGVYSPYSAAPTEGPNWLLWGGILLIIIVLIIFFFLIFWRRRKKDEEEEQKK
jgi:parallel beta-helix repeat protein